MRKKNNAIVGQPSPANNRVLSLAARLFIAAFLVLLGGDEVHHQCSGYIDTTNNVFTLIYTHEATDGASGYGKFIRLAANTSSILNFAK